MELVLKKILATLNRIEVKGRENMDYLLGAIIAIEDMISQLSETNEAERAKNLAEEEKELEKDG